MEELIIHMGTPKTGSSFLQQFFVLNSKLMKDSGILYPGVENNVFIEDSNEEINGRLLTKIFREHQPKKYFESLPEVINLLSSLQEFSSRKVFLSDESLGVFPSNLWTVIAAAAEHLEIKVKVFGYFRDPSTYYASHWSQVVRKHGEKLSLIEFTEQVYLPVWMNIIEMSHVFQNFHLSSYEQAIQEGGVEKFACKVLNINHDLCSYPKEKMVNKALSLHALTAIRMVNSEYGHVVGQKVENLLCSHSAVENAPRAKLPQKNSELVVLKHTKEFDMCKSIAISTCVN